VPPNPYRLRVRAVIGAAVAVVLLVAGFGIYNSFRRITTPGPPPPGCQAGTGVQAVTLDPEQASIAATIAGVAARHKLPRQAVTIAYAAALQESKLHNLDYGDRDSVGIFQQRPSEGWGPAADLKDTVYATTKFFAALVHVPGYTTMPVDQAAQEVQRSADGSAYAQWTGVAGLLSGYFTGQPPHGVSCWFTPAGKADWAAAEQRMAQAFGPRGGKHIVVSVTQNRSDQKKNGSVAVVHVRRDAAWTVANWLVTHAQAYHLREVQYAGYEWRAAIGGSGWRFGPDPPGQKKPPSGSIAAR
jgi:hypothetical protein